MNNFVSLFWLSCTALYLATVSTVAQTLSKSFSFDDREYDLDHYYADEDKVVAWGNKVGPVGNPYEQYEYHYLPFCIMDQSVGTYKSNIFWHAVQGTKMEDTGMDIMFKVSKQRTELCQVILNSNHKMKFSQAVQRNFWFMLMIDELPIYGLVGTNTDGVPKIYTHFEFVISYNGPQIVGVILRTSNPTPLEHDTTLTFTYQVSWNASDVSFADRFERYLDAQFFENSVHWFSLVNSFVLVLFLVGIVATIMVRTLNKDYEKYDRDLDDSDINDLASSETGWRQVSGDVFRPPPLLSLFSAMYGFGMQLTFLSLCVIVASLAGSLYATNGKITSLCVLGMVLSSFVSGYYSGGYYARNGGLHWIKNMTLSAFFIPSIALIIVIIVNVFGAFSGALAIVPFLALIKLLLLWIFVAFPLNIVGTLVGRNWRGSTRIPCKVNPVPRPIAKGKSFKSPFFLVPIGGILPFGSIFIEVYFVLSSFWNFKYYYVFDFLLVVFIMMITLLVCSSIVCTYILLNSEDYRWVWCSFLCGFSTAFYVYLYAIYYFFYQTKIQGLLQTIHFFSYTGVFCLMLGTMSGAISFVGASIFVRRIYRNLKLD